MGLSLYFFYFRGDLYMPKKINGKDNVILVEFSFVIDLDFAMYKFIKDKYGNSPYFNSGLKGLDDKEIKYILLSRSHINPLEVILSKEMDTTNLYKDILDNHYEELLSYAEPFDSLSLLLSFQKRASSLAIKIFCTSKLEEDVIKKYTNQIDTVIYSDRKNVPAQAYTAIYIKNFAELALYDIKNVDAMHIYVAYANYNMDEEQHCLNLTLVGLFGVRNEIHLIDLYTDIKFRIQQNVISKENNNGDTQ